MGLLDVIRSHVGLRPITRETTVTSGRCELLVVDHRTQKKVRRKEMVEYIVKILKHFINLQRNRREQSTILRTIF